LLEGRRCFVGQRWVSQERERHEVAAYHIRQAVPVRLRGHRDRAALEGCAGALDVMGLRQCAELKDALDQALRKALERSNGESLTTDILALPRLRSTSYLSERDRAL
jgi:hypothetical protein